MRRDAKRIVAGISRRINRNRMAGLAWKRQGEFITFEWDGFVEAPSIPLLFARHHYETTLIRKLLDGKAIGRSLEVGCGFGRLTPTFAGASAEHIAVDINPAALDAAHTGYPHLDFRETSVTGLPFPDDHFDFVTTWTVIQHVPPHLIDQAINELQRVLRPEGSLLLCEETLMPGTPSRHTWHRTREFYESRVRPLRLNYSSYIEEIDRIPGLASPGRVMLFEPAAR
jgi:ubiquinone/menaquinone biosynthesis C-methylase UbiE